MELYRAALKAITLRRMLKVSDVVTPRRSAFTAFDMKYSDPVPITICDDVLLFEHDDTLNMVLLCGDNAQQTIQIQDVNHSLGIAHFVLTSHRTVAIVAFLSLTGGETVSLHVKEISLLPQSFGNHVEHLKIEVPGLLPSFKHQLLLRGNNVIMVGARPYPMAFNPFIACNWRERTGKYMYLCYPGHWQDSVVS